MNLIMPAAVSIPTYMAPTCMGIRLPTGRTGMTALGAEMGIIKCRIQLLCVTSDEISASSLPGDRYERVGATGTSTTWKISRIHTHRKHAYTLAKSHCGLPCRWVLEVIVIARKLIQTWLPSQVIL